MISFRYSRWDGTQQVFDPEAGALLEELSEELLAHGDVRRALRSLFQRGLQGPWGERVQGLRELLERLRERRRQELQRYNLDSIMGDLRRRLDRIVERERQGIERRLQEAREKLAAAHPDERQQLEPLMKLMEQQARRNREFLDRLPQSLGGAIKQLMDYDFMDGEARREFQELLEQLRRRMLDNVYQNLSQQLRSLSPQDLAGLREMLRALNRMLREYLQGGEPDFQGFMQQFGPFFGPNPPSSLEELIRRLQQQMAQAQSLLESLSPEMRRELEELLDSLLDEETQAQLAQLGALMDAIHPLEDLRNIYPFSGEETLTLDRAMELMGRLQRMEELEQTLREVMRHGDLERLDPGEIEELLGEEARRSLETLKELERLLEEAGYLKRRGDRLELTPRGIRKIAQRALREIFQQLKKDRLGQHELYQRGSTVETTEGTKAYEYGDPFYIHIERTLRNAIFRQGAQIPVKLEVQDFEVYQPDHMTRAATVLLLDQSRSMGLFGNFLAAKKVALALYALIRNQFPLDILYILGFSDYAVELKEEELPRVTWNNWVSGTNMHHAFMLSRKLLSKHKGATRQIILITDGEPTAHLEGDRSYFSYPPSYRTIQETLKEAKRCTQEGIVINTFMLDHSYQLVDFVDQMTRINRGRAFYTTPDNLGRYVVVDYITQRRKRIP